MKKQEIQISVSENLTIIPFCSCLMLLQCILSSTSLFGWKLADIDFKGYPCQSITRNSLER